MKRLLIFMQMLIAFATGVSAQPDPGSFVIPEGYHEVSNWKDSFESFPGTVSATAKPFGWDYISTPADYSSMFTRTDYYKNTGSYSLNITNTSTYSKVDYLVTPAVKGDVKVQVRALSYAASYSGTQYMKIYKVTKNENGTFNAPTEADLINTVDLGLNNVFHEEALASLDDYTYLAITGSRAYVDDITADYAVVPENPGLKILSFTHGYNTSTNQMYADDEKNATFEGVVKVKNSGNVDLKVGRGNYGFTLESQKSNLTIDKEYVAIDKDLAVGEEYEIPVSFVMHIVKNDDNKTYVYSAIRAISQIVEYGKSNTSSSDGYYAQTSWFNFVNSEPSLDVRNASGSKMKDNKLDLGLVSGSGSHTIKVSNVGGSDAVITAIETTIPEGFSHNAELPLTIAKGETADVVLTIGGAEGYKEGTVTFTYGNDLEYTTKNISATVIAEGTYLETFGTILSPAKTYVPGGWINEAESTWEAAASSSNVHMKSSTQSYPTTMLISPKITFANGQALTVGATSQTTTFWSTTDAYLQVYYSTDRQNWTLANVITYEGGTKKSASQDVYGNNIEASKMIWWGELNGTTVDKVKAYTISGIPAGDYYIGFRSGYALIDYIFGGKLATVENDIVVDDFTVNPGKSTVNYDATASVTYRNLTDHAAAAHAVSLYDGDNLIEAKAGAELAAYASSTVDFTFTPRAAGNMNLKVVVENLQGGYAVESETSTVAIAEEVFTAEAMAGTRTTSTQNYVPGNLNYYNSRSEWFWTADKMTLKSGDVITSITLPYYNASKDLVVDKFELYLENTDQSVFATAKFTDIEAAGLKPVVSAENYQWKKAGTSSNHALVTFTLDEPFVYDGQNLHAIMINEDPDKTNYSTYYFEYYSSETGSSQYAYDDDYAKYSTKTPTRYSYVPVAIFGLEVQAPVLSGTITDKTVAVAGATVEAKSGNVVYSATTDADGKYSMEIKQPTLEYVVTVSADGKTDYVSDAMTIAEDKTFDYDFGCIVLPVNPEINYATFYDSKHAVKIPTGAYAFIFVYTMQEGLHLMAYSDRIPGYKGVIPAGEPVVITASGDIALEFAEDPLLDNEGINLLRGTDKATMTTVPEWITNGNFGVNSEDDCYFYGLSLNDNGDTNSVGFYWMNDTGAAFMNGAHKAYLCLPKSILGTEAKSSFVFADDVVTGVRDINVNSMNSSARYNLAGQRVNDSHKGIIISNGKKFINK